MPIEVHCPACPAEFHVGDEFAGRPGRCPECGVVLRVPEPEPEPAPDPYESRRRSEPRDDFPSRRRRDDYRTDEDRTREDFDDRHRGTSRGFDPHARAAAWERARKGLWYVQVAIILYAFSEIFLTGFMITRGIKEAGPNDFDTGMVAVVLGFLAVRLAAVGFWLLGRFAAIRVPYVPARSWAKISFGLGLTALFLLCTSFCLVFMALAAAQGGNVAGAGGLILVAVLGLLGLFLVAVGAEASALMSLIQIGRGLRDASAAGWAKVCLGLMVFLLVIGTVGTCGFFIYAADKQQKAQAAKAANKPAAADKADEKGKDKANGKEKAIGKEKAEGKDKADGKDNPPPNPFEQEPIDPTEQFVFNAVLVGLVFLYLLVYSIALAKVRGAIRREIRVLTGEADKDPWETDHRH